MRPRTDRQTDTQTDTQTRVTAIQLRLMRNVISNLVPYKQDRSGLLFIGLLALQGVRSRAVRIAATELNWPIRFSSVMGMCMGL